MNSLYKRIKAQKVNVPENYDLKSEQICDIKNNAIDIFDLICTSFKFGYLQGRRAERSRRHKGVKK